MFHVTPASNVPSIMQRGLIPQIGSRSALMEQESGIYLFKTEDAAADAVASWLGDEFEEDEPLALLEVNLPPDAEIAPTSADFEVVVTTPILLST